MEPFIKLFEEFTMTPKLVVEGSYKTKAGDYDGMHAFESRRGNKYNILVKYEDGRQVNSTGGMMNTQVNAALLKFYKEYGKNPEITKIEIKMDDTQWKVDWRVTIEESKDGKAWMGLTSRGGAGHKDGPTGSVARAEKQINSKIKGLSREFRDPKLESKQVYDFGWKGRGAYIRQIFIVYTLPSKYPPLQKNNYLDRPMYT